MEERNNELKVKRICRFCMTQKEPLTNIYSRENRVKNSVPLPLQIMAVSSLEVFTNDGMPSNICDACRLLMHHSYRFKQICKKSDTMLKQYPLTGVWPKALELPEVPSELVKLDKSPPPPQLKRPAPKSPSNATTVKKPREVIHEPEMVVLNASSPNSPKPVKLLNKAPKILNKNVSDKKDQVVSYPIIKTDQEGNVEIITELLDSVESYYEPDPIKFAPPVETNVFSCQHCDRSFPLRQLLDIHMGNHTRERCFECGICMKRFFSKYDLGKHMLIHTGEKPFECVVCSKRFSRSTLLHRHEKVHTDQPRFLCVYCEKTFLSQVELDRHTDQHKKNRPFSCKLCGKCFAFKQGLERHEVVHSVDQPHGCEYCEKSFTTPSKLARHLVAHAGERPYPCKLCPKSFLLSHHLTRHLRSHSAGVGSYKCIDCDSVFTARDDLIYHSAVHATQNLVCPLCKEQFEDLDSVTEHIKSHTQGEQFPCDYCDLIFTTSSKLEDHCISDHADYHKGNELMIKIENNTADVSGNQYVLEEIGAELARDNVSIRSYNKHDALLSNNSTRETKTYKTKKIQKFNENTNTNSNIEVLAEFEIRRSARSTKVKDYAQMVKMELSENEENEDEEEAEAENADDNNEDEEYILGTNEHSNDEEEDDDEEEEEAVEPEPVSPPKPAKQQTKGGSSQEKITKFLKLSDKSKQNSVRIEKNESVQNVLKNLPKGVTISKKEVAKEKKNVKEDKIVAIEKPKTIEPQQTVTQKVLRKTNPSRSTKEPRKSAELKKTPTRTKVEETPIIPKRDSNSTGRKISSTETSSKSTESSPEEKKPQTKLIEMKIGDKMVMVQKIMMTKDQVNSMKKEGKIEMKDGTMLFKPVGKNLPKIPKKNTDDEKKNN